MPESTTARCSQFAHPEITISHSDRGVIPDNASNLVRTLEDMVASGSSFGPGETIQIGWLYGQFRDHRPGVLTLFEPDLQGFPAVWSAGVTNILVTKRLQLDVADSFGLREQASFTSFRHSCLLCNAFSDGSDFFMSRLSPKDLASGWFIGCLDDRHDHNDPAHLRCISTYELITCVSREPLMYLALPPDIVVEVKRSLPRAAFADRDLEIAPGSFVEAIYRRAGRPV